MQIYGTFYGYEQRTNVSRLFKIYATDQGLFGAWIADRDYEEMLARFAGHGIGQQNVAGTEQIARNAAKWEQHYDELNLESPEFLSAHKENFHFRPNEVTSSLKWKLKMLERAATRFGALDLTASDGKKRRFYLVGRRTSDEVAAVLQNSMPATAIEDVPTASNPYTPLDNTTKAEGANTNAEPVHKSPNWLLIIPIYAAAWLLSFFLAAEFNFWWGIVVCACAPYGYRLFRYGGILKNFYSNSEEQLKRNRHAEDLKR